MHSSYQSKSFVISGCDDLNGIPHKHLADEQIFYEKYALARVYRQQTFYDKFLSSEFSLAIWTYQHITFG